MEIVNMSIIASILATLPLLFKKSATADEIPLSYDKKLIAFLEMADDAYIITNMNKKVSPFDFFATSELSNELIDIINNSEPKLFGTKDYRERRWTVISTIGEEVFIRKDIEYKNIAISRDITLTIGQNITEYWKVVKDGTSFLVKEILEEGLIF